MHTDLSHLWRSFLASLCDLIRLLRQQYHQAGTNRFEKSKAALLDESDGWSAAPLGIALGVTTHHWFWWCTSGYTLGLMLHHAGYSPRAQTQAMTFFAGVVLPALGPARAVTNKGRLWHSFMTDDGTPIELSWDWGAKGKSPKIRFSIEPVGLNAGTESDPWNQIAACTFDTDTIRRLPKTDLRWYDHFRKLLCPDKRVRKPLLLGHQSHIFYAFDLGEDIVAKAYFFPGLRAQERGQTVWESITDAIQTAPSCAHEKLGALFELEHFIHQPRDFPLELEMLATDLVHPDEARLKIYFRSRDTRLSSIASILTLNGKDTGESTMVGIENIKRLWRRVFQFKGTDDEPLDKNHHRTAGVLFYATFRLGDRIPSIKLYIPVRHYAANDRQVIKDVRGFQAEQNGDDFGPNYEDVLDQSFSTKALQTKRGIHTYLGCSIEADGTLRLISYLNPQFDKFRTEVKNRARQGS